MLSPAWTMVEAQDNESREHDAPAPAELERMSGDLAPGVTVPPFARSFPDDPELRMLVAAFEQGRYDVVRERAPKLAQSADDPQVAKAAQELRRRLDADPLAVKLLLGTLVLLVLLSSWAYLSHTH